MFSSWYALRSSSNGQSFSALKNAQSPAESIFTCEAYGQADPPESAGIVFSAGSLSKKVSGREAQLAWNGQPVRLEAAAAAAAESSAGKAAAAGEARAS